MSGTPRFEGMIEVAGGCFGDKLRPDPDWRIGVGEEDRAERDRTCAGRDQLECVESRGHSAHAHERQFDGRRAGVDGRQGDRLQGRTGVAARATAELRAKRLLVESGDKTAASKLRVISLVSFASSEAAISGAFGSMTSISL